MHTKDFTRTEAHFKNPDTSVNKQRREPEGNLKSK